MNPENRTSVTFTTAAVAAAAVVSTAGLAEFLNACGIVVPYLCFIVAIVGCCAVGGWALASWALVFSSFGLWFFFLPPTGFAWPQYSDAGHLVVFVGVAFFVCWIVDGQRRVNDELSRDNVALGCKLSALLRRVKVH
jgi:K+-sensing histidine kinase KdpD